MGRGFNSVLSEFGTTIFETMSRLAVEHRSINLGQGFPDENGPEDVLQAAADALLTRSNQYPSMWGIPELRQGVAEHEKRFYGQEVDGQREVLVTSGATESLASALFGLIEPGDEAVLIEPVYDSYLPIIRRAGGTARIVPLRAPEWTLDVDELAAAFNERTKLIVLNTPMNPCAKVFTADELALIAELVRRHDCYALCDEVYEHLVFDGRVHQPLRYLPGMKDRCVRIGSAGKTFSMTGWKVGYLVGPPDMIAAIGRAHQFLTYATPPNLQWAVAQGLRKDPAYFWDFVAGLQRKRDRLARGLSRAGFGVLDSQGTYFICADIRPIGGSADDLEFCRRLTVDAGVTAIPISAFSVTANIRHYIRFCFAKKDAVLDAAVDRLEKYFRK